MTAEGGWWQLRDGAELGRGQPVPVQQEQEPVARRVGERLQVVENRGGPAVHPCNRMKGYFRAPRDVKCSATGESPYRPEAAGRWAAGRGSASPARTRKRAR